MMAGNINYNFNNMEKIINQLPSLELRKKYPHAVTMTDKFMSGWGHAKGKTAKYVYMCETWEQVEIVAEKARKNGGQTYINECLRFPSHLLKASNYVQIHTPETAKEWYK